MTPEHTLVRYVHAQVIGLCFKFLDICPLIHLNKHSIMPRTVVKKEHWPKIDSLHLSPDLVTASIWPLGKLSQLSEIHVWNLQNEELGLRFLLALTFFASKFRGSSIWNSK